MPNLGWCSGDCRDSRQCSDCSAPQTVSATDDVGMLWGFLNGVPIYMPFGTKNITVVLPADLFPKPEKL